MSSKKCKMAARILPLLIAAAYAGNTLAQEQIEEMVVTAQKRREKLSEVPISITAISGAQLEARGIEGIANLNALAPNMMFRANPGTELISTVALRGSGTGQPAIWVDPSIGMYLDGVYIGKAQGSVFDVVELERVEVLRGPQGTLFGRNTEGGAVNLVSRRPSGVWSGVVGIEIGDKNHQVERIALDLPKMGIASVSVGYRKEDRDGWAKNLTGPDLGAKDKEAYRLAATLDFTKDFKLDYTFDHSEINNVPAPTSLYAVDGWAGSIKSFWLPYASAFGGVGVVTALGNAQTNAMLPYVTTSRPETVSSNGLFGIWERSRTEGHSLVAGYKLNPQNEVKYIYATRKMMYNDRQDIDGTPLAAVQVFPGFPWGMNVYYDRTTNYQQDSHELQWIGNTEAMKYVLGLYLFKDDGTTIGPQQMDFFGTGPIHSDYNSTTDAKAVYGQIDYRLTRQWTVTGGIRHTTEEKGGWTRRYNTTGFDGPFKSNTFGPVNYSASFSSTTPMASLAYKYSDTTNIYARLAKGFKSGGFSSELTSNAVLTPYRPETSVSGELGIKSSFFNNRAQLNAAVFLTKISDQQTTQLVPASTESFLTNAGKSTYKGFELEAALIPVDGWKIQGSWGYLNTKYDRYIDNALNIAGRPLIDTSGNKLPGYAPKNTVSLSLDGRLAKTDWGTLRAIADYTYTSSTYLYSVNKDLAAANAGGSYSAAMDGIPSLTNLNLKLLLAGIPVGGPGAADLALWVKNATDEKKIQQGIDFGMLRTANWQEPRSYGLSFTYKW